MSSSSIDIGAVPAWVEAVATAVAAVAAIVAGRYAVRIYLSARDALDDQRTANAAQRVLFEQQLAEQRDANADQIATNHAQREALERDRKDRDADAERHARTQAEHVTVVLVGSVFPSFDGEQQEGKVNVHNDSAAPIRRVSVGADAEHMVSCTSTSEAAIRAFGTAEMFFWIKSRHRVDAEALQYWVRFVDALGVEWQVTADGKLSSRINAGDPWETCQGPRNFTEVAGKTGREGATSVKLR